MTIDVPRVRAVETTWFSPTPFGMFSIEPAPSGWRVRIDGTMYPEVYRTPSDAAFCLRWCIGEWPWDEPVSVVSGDIRDWQKIDR